MYVSKKVQNTKRKTKCKVKYICMYISKGVDFLKQVLITIEYKLNSIGNWDLVG